MTCPRCHAREPRRASVLRGVRRAASRSPAPSAARELAPGKRVLRQCGARRRRRAAARTASTPGDLHPQAPRREDPHLEERPRRRAQAGHGPLRRPQGLDGAARRPRPRGGPEAPRPRPRADDGGRPSLRGHRQPGDGRRDHGALRGADRARGPRGARLLRRAADAAAGHPLRGRGPARRAARRCRSAWGSTRARWSCAPSAATSTWTTPPSGRRPIWPPGWSRWRSPGPRWSPATP